MTTGTLRRDTASTFKKGLAVLSVFEGAHDRLTLAEVAELTGFDRAVARRLVLTLHDAGYLHQDGRVFSLTPRVLVLAGNFLQSMRLNWQVQSVLDKWANKLACQITLGVRDDHNVVFISQARPNHHNKARVGAAIGSSIPVLHTAIGRMLVAMEPDLIADEILQTAPIDRWSSSSKVDRSAIEHEVLRCREQGYSRIDSEYMAGTVGLAVPVSRVDYCCTALGSCSLKDKVDEETLMRKILPALRECAEEIKQSCSLLQTRQRAEPGHVV